MVNELTIVNRFVFHALHRNLASLAVVARKPVYIYILKSRKLKGVGGSRGTEWGQFMWLTIT